MRFADPIPFAGLALDRAAHRRGDEAWLAAARAGEGARLLLFHKGQPLMDAARGASVAWAPAWLLPSALPSLLGAPAQDVFLGSDHAGAAYFAADAPEDFNLARTPIADVGEFADLRGAAGQAALADSALIGAARAILNWHESHRFCARCGGETQMVQAGWRRDCLACAAQHFPRVDPVVIMLPVLGEICCLGRQARFPPGMFSAFAGFVEPGETFEEACARELFEEAGLRMTGCRYLGGQPWPFPNSLMIGLIAEVADQALTLDPTEIEEAIWLTKEEARQALSGGLQQKGRAIWAPPPLAIAHHLLRCWVNA